MTHSVAMDSIKMATPNYNHFQFEIDSQFSMDFFFNFQFEDSSAQNLLKMEIKENFIVKLFENYFAKIIE